MRCDTCRQESPVILRVVVAKGYNRALARPLFNCPSCYEHKEQHKPYVTAASAAGAAQALRAEEAEEKVGG